MPLFTWSSVGRGFFSGKITRANAEQIRDQFDGSMAKSYYGEANFERLDRAWTLAQEKGLSVPQIALSYVLSYPLNIYALVRSMSSAELAANEQALDNPLTEAEMAWLDLRREER